MGIGAPVVAGSNAHQDSTASSPTLQRRRRVGRAAGFVLGGLVAGAAIGWSVSTVFVPSDEGLEEEAFATVAVVMGEVESSLALSAIASWPSTPVGVNAASGVVTTVDIGVGDEVSPGQRLYSVGLRPTVAGEGSIPSFSAIAPGDRGAHVGQLQRFLQAVGAWSGEITEVYSPAMVGAVREWQESAGMPVDGVVQQSDIVWVPELPAQLLLDTDVVRVGNSVSGGEQIVLQLPSAPRFVVQMQAAQAASTSTGTAVEVYAPDGAVWQATAAEQSIGEDGLVEVVLAPAGGDSLCGEGCDSIARLGETSLRADVITQPKETGLVVPVAALTTEASGDVFVTTDDGEQVPVDVLVTARGMAVVEGIDDGAQVRIPGEPAQ